MTHRNDRLITFLVAVTATVVAAVSALPYANSFNDGSRLATVESLVDFHTFAIDDSIFVRPPSIDSPAQLLPYPPEPTPLSLDGTWDKARINGHFYSDKPPIPALLMAGVYQAFQWSIGLHARQRADLFCYLMTLTSSGLAYVVAVVFAYRTGRTLGLTRTWSLLLCVSFALGTIALPYTRHVNGHIVLLGVGMPLFERLAALAERPGQQSVWSSLLLGTLAGFGYTVEQATGVLMLGGTLGVLLLRRPGLSAVVPAALAALPWIVLHHGIIYLIAGILKPIGAVPEFFNYPGSAFDSTNLTGSWQHKNLWAFWYYSGALLFGNRGFLQSDFPLFLAFGAFPFLLARLRYLRLEILFAFGLSLATWLVYSALSTNWAGTCCSIRWFVPLLSPGYFLLGLLLREYPRWRVDFLILSGWGIVLGAVMWDGGTWGSDIPYFWWINGAALVTWLGATGGRWYVRKKKSSPRPAPELGICGATEAASR